LDSNQKNSATFTGPKRRRPYTVSSDSGPCLPFTVTCDYGT